MSYDLRANDPKMYYDGALSDGHVADVDGNATSLGDDSAVILLVHDLDGRKGLTSSPT